MLSSDEPVPTEEQIADYWKNIETEREANREARANRPRGQGRTRRGGGARRGGRGGEGGGRRRYDEEEEVYDEDGNIIQVRYSCMYCCSILDTGPALAPFK